MIIPTQDLSNLEFELDAALGARHGGSWFRNRYEHTVPGRGVSPCAQIPVPGRLTRSRGWRA